jgi:hypothetical protein
MYAKIDDDIKVRVVRVARPGAGGKAAGPIIEGDRTSLSKGQDLPGEQVGELLSNSARIAGLLEARAICADAGATSEGEWISVEQYVRESTDSMGIATLFKALLAAGLIKF